MFLEGPSGSGKTTLLNLLGGVAVPEKGSVRVDGTDLAQLASSARDRFRAEHIGFIFQMFNLVPYLSVEDNVVLPCRFSAARRERASDQPHGLVGEAARLVSAMGLDLAEIGGRAVSALSVGQQQRVAAARALIGTPGLVIADEPTSALDTDSRTAFLDLLFKETTAIGATLVFVSHDRSLSGSFDRSVSLGDINRARPGSSGVAA